MLRLEQSSIKQQRWAAVQRRERLPDAVWVYAVVTTGVYCRAGCASRQPNPANVRFFETAAAAAQAGYRACKRCCPDTAPDATDAAIVAACAALDFDPGRSLSELAAAAHLSPFHFQRVFKRRVGVSPKQYAIARRRERTRERLQQGNAIGMALLDGGYGSWSSAYDRAGLGMQPGAIRNGGQHMELRVAFARSYLGPLAVVASGRGVCAIELGDSEDALRQRIAATFPHAALADDDDEFNAWVAAVVRLIEVPSAAVDLPLDIQGSAFQQRVWTALRAIPTGTTLTYAELAERIGNPSATRAVARACATNVLAVAVPCHRIIRSDGGLGGYRWGIERKQQLLDHERAES